MFGVTSVLQYIIGLILKKALGLWRNPAREICWERTN